MTLPPEFVFDVGAARRQLTALATDSPETRLALTVAELGDSGLESETEIYLRATEAAALLETVTDDQCLQAGARSLVVLRVGLAPAAPPPAEGEIERIRELT